MGVAPCIKNGFLPRSSPPDRFELIQAAGGDRNVGAMPGQCQRHRASDSAAAAGKQARRPSRLNRLSVAGVWKAMKNLAD
jgi:hypothetical protein